MPKERFTVRAQRSETHRECKETIIKLDEEGGGNIYGPSRRPALSQALSLRYYT